MKAAALNEVIRNAADFGPAGDDATDAGWPECLDLEALSEREPERPKFILPDWLPCGYATLIAGHGGIGKSGISLYLSICIAAGLPFFGLPVERRSRVLYLSCEDRESVLHWRLHRICTYLGISIASLRGWLEVVDLVGHDAVLWERDPQTGATVTPAFSRLIERMRSHQSQLLVVDGISDTFAGNENARADVKRYVNSLVSLVPADEGAVLLVGHIAKPTANGTPGSSEGYSGSTGWHNSVRARWYLYPETANGEDGGRPERTGELFLELQKSNLGRSAQQMRFAWDEQAHLFLGEAVNVSNFDRQHRDREEQAGIRLALKACIDSGDSVPAATTGQRTAFNVLQARAEFPQTLTSGKPSRSRFWKHLEQLRAMKHIREETITRKSDRHKVQILTLSEDGMRACGQ